MLAKTTGAGLSRKEFLKLGDAGLAGAALLGAAGCGGSSGGSGDLNVFWIPYDTGSLNKLISQFNKQSKDFKASTGRCRSTRRSTSTSSGLSCRPAATT
jgi:hypothetical protein